MIFYRKNLRVLSRNLEPGQKLIIRWARVSLISLIKLKLSNFWKRELTRPPKLWTEVLPILLSLLVILSHLRSSSIYHFSAKIRTSHTFILVNKPILVEPVVCQETLLPSQSLLNQMVQLIIASKKWKTKSSNFSCELFCLQNSFEMPPAFNLINLNHKN